MAALALAACAEVAWRSASGDDSRLAHDLAGCRAAAAAEVGRMYGPPVPAATDPRFGADPVRPSGAERQLQESQRVTRCMKGKGYELAPAAR